MTLQFHQYAEIFPMMQGEAFDTLVEDIRLNGVREPIQVLDRKIVDGRNRYGALCRLVETAEPRGSGWGVFQGMPLTEEDLQPGPSAPWFAAYSELEYGDPLRYVISKNLTRRHLNDSQRAAAAAKIANFTVGRPSAEIPPTGGITTAQAADMMNVSPRQVERARAVQERGSDEVKAALDKGEITPSAAERIARRPEDEQRKALNEGEYRRPGGDRAIMASRKEPDDSLDFFPTPPWATRALMEEVLPRLQSLAGQTLTAWEPACGEGHIAEVLKEYMSVYATDVHDYGGDQDRLLDFLGNDWPPHIKEGTYRWIITNPPFGDKAVPFVLKALQYARDGVAMFFRSQWAVEGVERYEQLFRDRPPTLMAFFTERVNLCKGRWDPNGTTATAYCWLVWVKGEAPRAPMWIPPGCRQRLTHEDDIERFTAHPVRSAAQPAEPTDGSGVPSSGNDAGAPDGGAAVVPAAVPPTVPSSQKETAPPPEPDIDAAGDDSGVADHEEGRATEGGDDVTAAELPTMETAGTAGANAPESMASANLDIPPFLKRE